MCELWDVYTIDSGVLGDHDNLSYSLLLSGNLYFAVPSEKNPIIHIFVSL